MTNEEYREYLLSPKWKQKAEARMKIDGYRCQGCGSCGTVDNPLEVHHLSYIDLGKEDIYTQLVTVCHCCHKNIHNVMERQTNIDGRRGWLDSPRVPQLHVYNVSGYKKEFLEEE